DFHVTGVQTCALPILFKLLNYLDLVAWQTLLINQVNVLEATIIERKIVDVVVMYLSGFIDNAIAWCIQIGFNEPPPFGIRKLNTDRKSTRLNSSHVKI